jgi:preprotein translocase subunit YajC
LGGSSKEAPEGFYKLGRAPRTKEMAMLISPAYAQIGGAGGFDLMALAPLVLIFVVFYFLLIRPQQKRMKEHKEMLGKVQRNDRIVTNGGLVGKVAKVHDERDELELDIADNVRVTVRRGMISEVISKSGGD